MTAPSTPASTAPAASTYTLGKLTLTSRLIVGSGKYRSFDENLRCVEASGAEMVTVALRRVDFSAPRGERLLFGALRRVLTSPARSVRTTNVIQVIHGQRFCENGIYIAGPAAASAALVRVSPTTPTIVR